MKVKIDTTEIKDLPDDVAALIIADPSYNDEIPDLSTQEVNVLVHGVLSSIYDPALSFEENTREIKHRYISEARPNKYRLNKALGLIETYNKNINEEDIGSVEFSDMFQTITEPLISKDSEG